MSISKSSLHRGFKKSNSHSHWAWILNSITRLIKISSGCFLRFTLLATTTWIDVYSASRALIVTVNKYHLPHKTTIIALLRLHDTKLNGCYFCQSTILPQRLYTGKLWTGLCMKSDMAECFFRNRIIIKQILFPDSTVMVADGLIALGAYFSTKNR